jgi:hypothetical protein
MLDASGIGTVRSDGPDVDLLGDDAPVGVVVVGADDVQVLHVCIDLDLNGDLCKNSVKIAFAKAFSNAKLHTLQTGIRILVRL